MYKELIRNISILFKESKKLSKKDINGDPVKGSWNLYGVKIICAIISAIIVLVKGSGFSSNFLEFVTSFLSILVGLFITALIFSFDKFYEPKTGEDLEKIKLNAQLRIWDTQAYNYTKKFAFMTSQTIVTSVFVLFLVAIENLFPISQINIIDEPFITSLKDLTCPSFGLFLLHLTVFVFRFLIIFWLLTIMSNTLYIVSGMVDYMIKKNDRNDFTKN